ncbi:hypothetical protein LJB95_02755, partial [Paludibacteraceae bacterium OttesenSCG-928-F17]|nr:hypothetical protein [Paludibacteraceae bacterium OttesenSCG-928-F17]
INYFPLSLSLGRGCPKGGRGRSRQKRMWVWAKPIGFYIKKWNVLSTDSHYLIIIKKDLRKKLFGF